MCANINDNNIIIDSNNCSNRAVKIIDVHIDIIYLSIFWSEKKSAKNPDLRFDFLTKICEIIMQSKI